MRFDLFAILEWTAGIAFLCALFVGTGTQASCKAEFVSTPPDDARLLQWLKDSGHDDVLVAREGQSIKLSSEQGIVDGVRNSFGLIPQPPWQDLGYGACQSMRTSMRWTIFHASAWVWLIGFGVLFTLGMIRRYFIKPISDGSAAEGNA